MKQIMVALFLVIILTTVTFVAVYSLPTPKNSEIPSWIKNTAGFWVNDKISDQEFISALQFLINQKILIIPTDSKQVNNQLSLFDDKIDKTAADLLPLASEMNAFLTADEESTIEGVGFLEGYYGRYEHLGANKLVVWIYKFDSIENARNEYDSDESYYAGKETNFKENVKEINGAKCFGYTKTTYENRVDYQAFIKCYQKNIFFSMMFDDYYPESNEESSFRQIIKRAQIVTDKINQ